MWRGLAGLTLFMTVCYGTASYGQQLHDPHTVHDTLNIGGSGGGGGGNANYATNAGNANTANYATNAGTANTATNSNNAYNVLSGGNVVTNSINGNTITAGTGGFIGPSITLTGTANASNGNFQTITSAGDGSVGGNLILPNASGTTSVIRLGPATTAGVSFFRNGNGVLQVGLGDFSGNAVLAAQRFQSTNDSGVSTPNFNAGYQTSYGVYVRNSTPATGFVGGGGWLLQADTNGVYNYKKNVQSKTANYTLVAADSGVNFDNTGATGAITFTLPAVASGINACFSTTAAQVINVTTPTGAIVGGSYSSGATRSVNTQYVTFCVTAHGANYVIDKLVGTIAS